MTAPESQANEQPRVLPEPPPFSRSFHLKLMIFVGAVIAGVATAVGAAAYLLARDTVQDRIGMRLGDMVWSRSLLVQAQVEHLERETAIVTRDADLRDAVQRFHDGAIGEPELVAEAGPRLSELRASADVILEMAVASIDGRILASTDASLLDTDISSHPAFIAGQVKDYLGFPMPIPSGGFESRMVARVTGPTGEVVGFVFATVDMTSIFRMIDHSMREWTTGEILIADLKDGKLRYLFRPNLESTATSLAETPVMLRALRGESGTVELWDYRGHVALASFGPVVHERAKIVHRDWAIMAKIDRNEAYAPVRHMRTVTFLVAAFLGLVTLAATYAFARRFTGPIRTLARNALAISTDPHAVIDLQHRSDEIGTLASSLNQMRSELLAGQEVLEKRVEKRTADLREANLRLESEVAERVHLTEALRDAKEAAEASSKAKSAFLAAMSHEIRTPMNGIVGMADLLATTPLAPIQREYLGMVQESSESLLQIINDILDFSRMEAGRLELEDRPFELRELVGSTVRAFADRAHQKGLELALRVAPQVPDGVVGDPLRLRQVLVNLLGNAIKFTERGEVILNVDALVLAGQVELRFEVRDTGIGIPKDRLAAIFSPFEQADISATRRFGGAGLGLTIASRLVEQMEGKIEVESTPGQGSSFRFNAILELAAEADIPKRVPPEYLEGLRVLVVDDNETNLRILEELLRQWKMEPRCIRRSTEVREVLAQARNRGQDFHLILLDANMPELDGFSLVEQLQADESVGGPFIMMLSSSDRPGDVARCKQLGIDIYLLKPVKQSDLRSAIERVMGLRHVVEDASAKAEFEEMAPLRILLAEDNRVSQRLVVDLLEKWGHRVTVANNGREAVELMSGRAPQQQFDVVLMDVQMPELDGLSATGAIRAIERTSGGHVPIIAMTAHAMKGDRERCLEAGMDGYLSKPIRAQDLRFAVNRFGPAKGRAKTAEIEREPIIDWQRALEQVEAQESILLAMAQAFVEDGSGWLADIDQAVAEVDATALRRSAHALKGAAQAMASDPVSDLAAQLERAGQMGDLSNAPSLAAQVRTRTEALIASLQNRLVQSATTTAAATATSEESRKHGS